MISERNILIWLNNLGISNNIIIKLYEYFDNLCELWYINEITLLRCGFLKKETVNKIIRHRSIEFIEMIFSNIDKYNINVITILDDEYPHSLINVFDKPVVIM